jgi:hypothetical protein
MQNDADHSATSGLAGYREVTIAGFNDPLGNRQPSLEPFGALSRQKGDSTEPYSGMQLLGFAYIHPWPLG